MSVNWGNPAEWAIVIGIVQNVEVKSHLPDGKYYFMFRGTLFGPYDTAYDADQAVYRLVAAYPGFQTLVAYRGIDLIYKPADDTWYFNYQGTLFENFASLEAAQALADTLLAAAPVITPTVEGAGVGVGVGVTKAVAVPTLPWYASWLGPFLDYLGSLWESGMNYLGSKWGEGAKWADSVVTGIENSGAAAVEALISKLGDLGKGLIGPVQDSAKNAADEAMKAISPHSPDPELQQKLTKLVSDLKKAQEEAVKSISHSQANPDEAPNAGMALSAALIGVQLTVEIAGAILDIAHPIKKVGAQRLSERMIDNLAVGGTVGQIIGMPAQIGLLRPLMKHYMSLYTPEIPDASSLIEMHIKGIIDKDTLDTYMGYLGLNKDWSDATLKSAYQIPDASSLIEMYLKGAIDRGTLDTYMGYLGIKKDWIDANLKAASLVPLNKPDLILAERALNEKFPIAIPGYADLQNMRMKEIIGQKEFQDTLKLQGFATDWADKLWGAHFGPPTLSDILVAYRRKTPVSYPKSDPVTGTIVWVERPGGLGLDDVKYLLESIDLDPRYMDIFMTRTTVDPSLSLARFLYETGVITPAQVAEIVHRTGIHPDYEKETTDFVLKFQERLFRRRYLTTLLTGVIRGAYTPDELSKAVADAGYSEGVAHWMIEIADARKKIAAYRAPVTMKARLLSPGDLTKAFERDYITEDVYRTELMIRGYEIGDVDLKVKLILGEKVVELAGGPKVALSQAELLNAWRWNEMSEDAVRIELQLRGLSPEETDILIATKKKQWTVTPK